MQLIGKTWPAANFPVIATVRQKSPNNQEVSLNTLAIMKR